MFECFKLPNLHVAKRLESHISSNLIQVFVIHHLSLDLLPFPKNLATLLTLDNVTVETRVVYFKLCNKTCCPL